MDVPRALCFPNGCLLIQIMSIVYAFVMLAVLIATSSQIVLESKWLYIFVVSRSSINLFQRLSRPLQCSSWRWFSFFCWPLVCIPENSQTLYTVCCANFPFSKCTRFLHNHISFRNGILPHDSVHVHFPFVVLSHQSERHQLGNPGGCR